MARSQDCWARKVGWSDAPAPVADSPMTKGTQSFQASTVWLCEKTEMCQTDQQENWFTAVLSEVVHSCMESIVIFA